MSEEYNSDIYLRPRFSFDLDMTQEALIGLLKNKLGAESNDYKLKQIDNHFFVDIVKEKAHYWSPQLHIEVLDNFKGSSLLKGLFTPRPHVWTLFIFLHLIAGSLLLIFSIMLYVRWTLDGNLMFPTIMTIVTPILWIAFYFFGRWGRSQGKDQMKSLYAVLIKVLEK